MQEKRVRQVIRGESRTMSDLPLATLYQHRGSSLQLTGAHWVSQGRVHTLPHLFYPLPSHQEFTYYHVDVGEPSWLWVRGGDNETALVAETLQQPVGKQPVRSNYSVMSNVLASSCG